MGSAAHLRVVHEKRELDTSSDLRVAEIPDHCKKCKSVAGWVRAMRYARCVICGYDNYLVSEVPTGF